MAVVKKVTKPARKKLKYKSSQQASTSQGFNSMKFGLVDSDSFMRVTNLAGYVLLLMTSNRQYSWKSNRQQRVKSHTIHYLCGNLKKKIKKKYCVIDQLHANYNLSNCFRFVVVGFLLLLFQNRLNYRICKRLRKSTKNSRRNTKHLKPRKQLQNLLPRQPRVVLTRQK